MDIFKNNVVNDFIFKICFLFLVFTCLNLTKVNATKHTVHVKDHQFVPATLNAVLGDTILWVWDDGTHTTTGTSVNIPSGADTWDAPIDASNQSFEYIPKIAGTYFYFSKLDGDMSASFTVTGTLPVQLINFTVSNTKNNTAYISWNTVTEQNTSFFSVQRSIDAIHFNEIARINAAGNSSVLKSYSYTDNNISASNKYLYYKIIIEDKDGKSSFSNVKIFKNNLAALKLVTAVSPNPVCSYCNLNVQFNANKDDKVLVQVYNIKGVLIKQTTLTAVEGLNNQSLSLDNLSAGIYTIVFKLHDLTDTKRIVLR
jgi:plastocyanin